MDWDFLGRFVGAPVGSPLFAVVLKIFLALLSPNGSICPPEQISVSTPSIVLTKEQEQFVGEVKTAAIKCIVKTWLNGQSKDVQKRFCRIGKAALNMKTPLRSLSETFKTRLEKQLPDKPDCKNEMRTLVIASMESFRIGSCISPHMLFYVLPFPEVSCWFADGVKSSDVQTLMMEEMERLVGLSGQVGKNVTNPKDVPAPKPSGLSGKHERQDREDYLKNRKPQFRTSGDTLDAPPPAMQRH